MLKTGSIFLASDHVDWTSYLMSLLRADTTVNITFYLKTVLIANQKQLWLKEWSTGTKMIRWTRHLLGNCGLLPKQSLLSPPYTGFLGLALDYYSAVKVGPPLPVGNDTLRPNGDCLTAGQNGTCPLYDWCVDPYNAINPFCWSSRRR